MDERQYKRELGRRRKKRKQKKIKQGIFVIVLLVIIIVVILSLTKVVNKISDKKDQPVHSSEMMDSSANEENTSQDPVTDVPEVDETITASILSAGDMIIHDPFIDSSFYQKDNGSYDYTSIFSFIKDDYENADFAVINMESTICDDNYGGYPKFRAPEGIVTSLYENGVDMCLLANNHIYDNKEEGLFSTIKYMEQNSMLYIGAQDEASDKTYVIEDINGIKVGFFNYTYASTASDGQLYMNDTIPVDGNTAKLLNTYSYDNLGKLYDEIELTLTEMKASGVEYTVAYIHWGGEYKLEENQTQRNIAANLCELGIDALIGSHPHVVQPVDVITSASGDHQMLCVYSVGNHLSNQRREEISSVPTGHTEDGLMVELTLEKDNIGNVSLTNAEFIPTHVYKTTENGDAQYYLLPIRDVETLIQETKTMDLNISNDIEASLDRTMNIIGDGVEKIENALPLS